MKRITITIPDDVARDIAREAKRAGKSVSALIREALALRERPRRRHLQLKGMGRSGKRRTARDADAALAEGFASARSR